MTSLLAAALLVWPGGTASRRLAALVGVPKRSWRIPKPSTALAAVGAALVGGLLLNVGGAVAGVLVGAVIWRRWHARRQLQRRIAVVAELAETLRAFVTELRAGAHPIAAAASVAVDAPPVGADAMRAIVSAARVGSDAEQVVHEPLFAEVVHAWTLAQRHGLPLADVLDSVVGDFDQRVRFARQTQARMAGPKASATVLTLLPAAGLMLGEAMGAGPFRILATTAVGQLLLVTGTVLICAGVMWSARITQRAVLP